MLAEGKTWRTDEEENEEAAFRGQRRLRISHWTAVVFRKTRIVASQLLHPDSVISHPDSVISHPDSVISHPNSVISHPESRI